MKYLMIGFALLASLCASALAEGSIGVIDGADGPTAILVSGSFGWLWWAAAGAVIVTALIVCLIRKRKK